MFVRLETRQNGDTVSPRIGPRQRYPGGLRRCAAWAVLPGPCDARGDHDCHPTHTLAMHPPLKLRQGEERRAPDKGDAAVHATVEAASTSGLRARGDESKQIVGLHLGHLADGSGRAGEVRPGRVGGFLLACRQNRQKQLNCPEEIGRAASPWPPGRGRRPAQTSTSATRQTTSATSATGISSPASTRDRRSAPDAEGGAG